MGAVAHYSSSIVITFCLSLLINEIVPCRHLVAEKDSEYKLNKWHIDAGRIYLLFYVFMVIVSINLLNYCFHPGCCIIKRRQPCDL